MTPPILIAHKPVGKTPLDILTLIKDQYPQFSSEKLAYAGRLDPMAEGLLLVLVGDECKKRKYYEQLDKEYLFSCVLGITTDSYDLLGIPHLEIHTPVSKQELTTVLHTLTGSFMQQYPPYSAARVHGKPLYYYAHRNLLDTIKIPTKQITVATISDVQLTTISAASLLKTVQTRVNQVHGEFRQHSILEAWNKHLQPPHSFQLVTASISCSSGTYVRSVVHALGKMLGSGATTFSITRTRIGQFTAPTLPLNS